MVLHRPNPNGKKIKYKRPEIWEDKSEEKIKETLLHIIDTEGIKPFIQGVNQEKSNIEKFFEDKEYLLDESAENIIIKIFKDNIDDIAKFIYNYNAVGFIHSVEFDKPVYSYNNTREKNNIFSIGMNIGFYNWPEHKKDAKDFYKYHYYIFLW